MSEKIALPRGAGAIALKEYLEARLADCREILEDIRFNDEPLKAVDARARINEIKEIFDLFGFPTA
jgi:hypothetical protein